MNNPLINITMAATKIWYFTINPKPNVIPLRSNILSLLVRIQEKNRNREMEKKKSSIVSINAILQRMIKPGIDASKILESIAFLGP